MSLIWAHQSNSVGLGDFIRIAPTILTLSLKHSKPIPTFFDSPQLSQLYTDCPYIEILPTKPDSRPIVSTTFVLADTIKFHKKHNIYHGVHFTIHGEEDFPPATIGILPAYSLSCPNPVSVINGCNPTGNYSLGKDIGEANRKHILTSLLGNGLTPVILGTVQDKARFWSNLDLEGCVDLLGKTSLVEAVSIVQQSKFFISNDTCLYHIGSCIGKRGLVFWRKTSCKLERNPTDKEHIYHHNEDNISTYPAMVDRYLKASWQT